VASVKTENRPKKVMRIIARLNVGGPAVHCTLLSSQLSKFGYDTVLVTGQVDPSEASFEEVYQVSPEGYRLIRLGKLSRVLSIGADIKSFLELIRLMRKERPDIVHTHTAKAGVLGRIAATLTGVPIIIHTFHGHVLSGYFSPLLSKLVTLVERVLATNTTAIVTLSPSLKKELSESFRLARPAKFRVIPLGRDLAPFFDSALGRGSFRKSLHLSDETVLFGIIGRLVPIKFHSLLLDACANLKTKKPWHLAIVGEGPLSESLLAQVKRLGLEKNVSFLGWRSDLPQIYTDLDFMVLCSKNEGTPLSIIESFAAGCPVISTRVGGVPDMFTPKSTSQMEGNVEICEEGILIPSENVSALTKALEIFIEREELLQRCKEISRKSAEKYSDGALVQNVASLYQELLAGQA
jgi:glycosyltransferase involved in cell wall biosynthesis